MLNDALKTTLNRRFEHHTAQPLFRSLTRRRDAHLFTHSRQRTWKNSSEANRFPKIPPLFLIYAGSVWKRKGAAEKCVYCTRHTRAGRMKKRSVRLRVCPRLRYFNVLFIWSRSQVLWSHRELLAAAAVSTFWERSALPMKFTPSNLYLCVWFLCVVCV